MSQRLLNLGEAEVNFLDAAAFIAERLESADGRAEAMSRIVPRYLAAGNVDLAAALADIVEDPTTRDSLLTAVAEKSAEIGDDEYALQLADAIEDFSLQSQAKERVAVRMANRGEIAGALEIAAGLDHPDEVLTAAAVRQWGDGQESDAVSTVDGMVFAYSKCIALQHFAVASARAGGRDRAVELLQSAAKCAEDIDFTEERIRARVDIGNNLVDVKRNDLAISILDEARSDAETLQSAMREGFLSNVAVGFFRAGSVDFADRVLDGIEDKSAVIATLSGFASVHIQRGESAEALEALREAHEIILSQVEKETRDHRVKFNQWATLASKFAACGELQKAIGVAEEIPDDEARSSALAKVALAAAEKGEEILSVNAIGLMREPIDKAYAFLARSDMRIAEGSPEQAAEELTRSLVFLPEMKQPALRSALLIECVQRRFRIGQESFGRTAAAGACSEISTIVDGSIRAVRLADLAGVYIGAGLAMSEVESEALHNCIGGF